MLQSAISRFLAFAGADPHLASENLHRLAKLGKAATLFPSLFTWNILQSRSRQMRLFASTRVTPISDLSISVFSSTVLILVQSFSMITDCYAFIISSLSFSPKFVISVVLPLSFPNLTNIGRCGKYLNLIFDVWSSTIKTKLQ